jgi:ribosomal protein L3 glutamine methyltransferase
MMQAGALIEQGTELFEHHGLVFGHGTDDAQWDAAWIVYHVTQQPFTQPVDELELSDEQVIRIEHLFQRRVAERIPVAYLLQEAYFAGLSFYVDERVLIPRSPVAELIERQFTPWLLHPPSRILDMGTGSGCIAIACAYAFPEAHVDAVDTSDDALAVARINVQRHRLTDRVQLHQSDVWRQLPAARYDLIVSNPPYVSQAEMESLPPEFTHEPALGLAAGDDGLVIVDRILQGAAQFLTPDGILIVEVGNSEPALIEKYPEVPFTWLSFAHGGQGVFLLTANEVTKHFSG